ncbi:helix-turn-helix domain-containing protein [Xenorhabdus sp. PB30.3]|nr:helix-turn-helix domain-containing protein [Xenorhabdus sp. PB30.3]
MIIPIDERDEDYVSISYTKGANDDETIPHEVISVMIDERTTLHAAWRIYRGFSRKEVAEQLGIKQTAVFRFEKAETLRSEILEKLALLYDCKPTQLILDF